MKVFNIDNKKDLENLYPLERMVPLVDSDKIIVYGQVFTINQKTYKVLQINYPLGYDYTPTDLVWASAEELPAAYQHIWTQNIPATGLKYTTFVTCPYCGAVDDNPKKVQNSNYYCGYCDSYYAYKRKRGKYFSTPKQKSSAINFDIAE